MAIESLNETGFREILSKNFTPSATIKTPERLLGRDRALRSIDRALASPGRQIFIYGDRGVGKTSVAQTAGYIHQDSGYDPIYVVCSQGQTFSSVIQAVGNSVVDVEKRLEQGASSSSIGLNIMGAGGSYQKGDQGKPDFSNTSDLNSALDVIRYIGAKRSGNQIVIIDEMERISDPREKERFAEFIKNVPELGDRIKFIFCGIATTLDELIGAHPSAGRVLETINLEKLHHNYLWEIISGASEKAGIKISREMLIRIGQISDGFPHYVHLIGESMFWSAFDDNENILEFSSRHFMAGIKGAISRAETTLRHQYQRATMKTRNTDDYEEALWALADNMSDRRQVTEIYDSSYKRIVQGRSHRKPLDREKFNQRLLALRKEGHGNILIGYGAGWFGFRENIIRGYVRLRAEQEGVELGRDLR